MCKDIRMDPSHTAEIAWEYLRNNDNKIDSHVLELWRKVFPKVIDPYFSDCAAAEKLGNEPWFWNLAIQIALSDPVDWLVDIEKALILHSSQEGLIEIDEQFEKHELTSEVRRLKTICKIVRLKWQGNIESYANAIAPLANHFPNSLFAQEYLDALTFLESKDIVPWLSKYLNLTYRKTIVRWKRLFEELQLIDSNYYSMGLRKVLSGIDPSDRHIAAEIWAEHRRVDPEEFTAQKIYLEQVGSVTNLFQSLKYYLEAAVPSPADSPEVIEALSVAKWALSGESDIPLSEFRNEYNNSVFGPPCRLAQLRLLADAIANAGNSTEKYLSVIKAGKRRWCPLHEVNPVNALEFIQKFTVPSGLKLTLTRLGTEHFASLALNSRPMNLNEKSINFLTRNGQAPLLPWQEGALASWAAHGRVGVITAATGTGKSRLGVAAFLEAHQEDFGSILLTHRLVIKGQWKKDELFATEETDIQGFGFSPSQKIFHLGMNVNELSSEDSYDYDDPPRVVSGEVLLALDKSLSTRLHLLPAKHTRSLLVADEVHQFAAEAGQRVLTGTFDRKMGFSATVGYEDSLVMQHFESGLVADYPIHRAIKDKVISEYNLLVIRVPLIRKVNAFGEVHEIDLSSTVEENFSEDDLKNAENAMIDSLTPLIDPEKGIKMEQGEDFEPALERVIRNRDPDYAKLARKYIRAKRNYDRIVRNAQFKVSVLQLIAPAVEQYGRTLVFANLKKNGRDFEEELTKEGVNVAYIDSDTEQSGRSDIFRALQMDEIKAIIAPQILDEGVNIPNARIGIFLGPGNKGYRQVVQRMGRVLRKKPDSSDKALLILAVGIGTREDPGPNGDKKWYGGSTYDVMEKHSSKTLIVDYEDPAKIRTSLDSLLD
jgi:superfamily II DNA or RNA helicase